MTPILQIAMVSKLKNEYFLELLGYCLEDGTRMLAYQFATMGSLHNILHGDDPCISSTAGRR